MLGGDFLAVINCRGKDLVTASGKAPGQTELLPLSRRLVEPPFPTCTGTPNGKCIDPNMLALAKLYPGPNADPNATGRLQLRPGRDLQPEQPAVGGSRRLEHQRQHQGVCPLQLPARSPAVPGWPVVAERRPGAVSDSPSRAGTSRTPVPAPSPTSSVQSMTNETVVAYTFVGFPNVFANPIEGRIARKVGYGYNGLFKNGVASDSLVRASSARAKRPWFSIRAVLRPAELLRACMPISTCPASATPSPR